MEKKDGHPDFVYLRKTIEALEIEEELRNKIIRKLLMQWLKLIVRET